MIVKVTAQYKFGGVTMPIYKGTVSVEFNADWSGEPGTVAADDAMDLAKSRLRKKVQQDSAWNGDVVLSNIELNY